MIRKAFLTLGMLAVAAAGYAQNKLPCATDEFYKQQKAVYPGIEAQEAQLTADIDKYLKGRFSNNPNAKTTAGNDIPWPLDTVTLHIPVVVHIISDFSPGSRFIKDDDIYGMIARLNLLYSASNPDLPGIIKPFKPYIGNAHVQFHLANKDPQGKPTRGITRTYSYQAAGGDELAKIGGWAQDQYLNIYLENFIGKTIGKGTVLAYATFPTSYTDNPYSQGVISRADQALPLSGGLDNGTIGHEIGHYLFLYHVWNSNNVGPDLGVCGDDEVDDTPPTEGHFDRGCRLYDTLCATGYFREYDSATYYQMSGVNLPSVVTSNLVTNTTAQYTDSTNNIIGQTFNTGSEPAYLASIILSSDTGTYKIKVGAATTMSLYDATGTTLLAKSAATLISPGVKLTYNFAGVALAANTTYKFVIDTIGGHVSFRLKASNGDPYGAGNMFNGAGANTPVPGSDLYFVVNRRFRIDYPDTVNTQNIMDYSACSSQMFTKGQTARMRGSLYSNVGMRAHLVDPANLRQTGVIDASGNFLAPTDIAPTAALSVNRPFVCADGSTTLTFSNRSYNDTVTNASWTFDHGASNATSADPNQVNNSFTTPGWVNISLTVTGNNTGSNTITKNNLVYVAETAPTNTIGYFQEFNPGGDLDKYPIFNFFGTEHKWELVNNAGVYDNTSIRYANFDARTSDNISNTTESPRGDYSDFYTPAFNLSTYGSGICNLSFFSAGAFRTNKPSEMNDKLEISASTDCGETWRLVDTLTGGRIANNGYRNDRFTPIWSEWKEQSISVPTALRASQTYLRFRFKAGVANPGLAIYGLFPSNFGLGTGNNFYLDRFSITNAPLGVKNGVIVNLGMSVAPNPTSGAATVSLNGGDNSLADLTVTDVTGKLVYSSSVARASTTTKVEIPAAAIAVKGMYLVKVVTNGATETQKLVVY